MATTRYIPEKRTEVIRGVEVEEEPKVPLHSTVVTVLGAILCAQLAEEWLVRSEQALTFGNSEPVPDMAVVAGPYEQYYTRHPSTAQLVAEVCVTSEALDRVKLELYAEAAVAECWLILANEKAVERYTEPLGSGYLRKERLEMGDTLESTAVPGISLAVADLFPQATV